MSYPRLVENLIEQLVKLPGVGRRSAERMVFWFLDNSKDNSLALSKSLLDLKERMRFCKECNNLTEEDICSICSSPKRDHSLLCIVEDPKHLLAIERTGSFNGIYHVLLGAIAPSEGRGPDDLKIQDLALRINTHNIKEVVIATDPDTEGEMTALHIANVLRPLGIKLSRIGLGIPVGSSVEYADLSTLTMSMNARREITN